MEEVAYRSIKSIVLGVICFISVKALGLSITTAALVASLPMILGILNIMTSLAYGVAVFSFIIAVGWYVVGDENRALVTSVWSEAKSEFEKAAPKNAPAPAPIPPTQ